MSSSPVPRQRRRGRTPSSDEGDAILNQNVSWLDQSPWLFPFYLFMIGFFRLLLVYAPISSAAAWTTTHLLHGLFSFIGFHWNKGSMLWEDQGEYQHLTFWEQMDAGIPWTNKKKVLLIVPVILYIITTHVSGYATSHLILNTPVMVVLVIAKLPELHRIRIFGINK